MKKVNWNSPGEFKIGLVPNNGADAVSLMVYGDYGNPSRRAVLAIASRVGGRTVYFEFTKGCRKFTVPFAGWNDPTLCGCFDRVTSLFGYAADYGYDVACFGSDRVRYAIEIEAVGRTVDAIDNGSDRESLVAEAAHIPEVERNGLRSEF